MRRCCVLIFFLLLIGEVAFPQNSFLKDKTYYENVIPYENEGMIRDGLYEQSPYYYALKDGWRRIITDSSIVYTRFIEPEKTWKDYAVFLNFRCARKSIVKLNGILIDSYDDYYSLHTANLSNSLKQGKTNVLTIEALKTSPYDVVTDTALSVGLRGCPYLIFKSPVHICEYSVYSEYSTENEQGMLSLEVNVASIKQKGRYYIDISIFDADGTEIDKIGQWVIAEKNSVKTVLLSRIMKNIRPWNAETPSYYTLVLSLRDEDMNIEEMVGCNTAFRNIGTERGIITLNGENVFLKGVVFDEILQDDNISKSEVESIIKHLKKNRVNALFLRQPSYWDELVLQLCDKYGMYVIGTANLEPVSNMHISVSSDRKYIPLFESRVASMVNTYKNHSSVIGWTIGDINDNGICTQAAFSATKKLDNNRCLFGCGNVTASLSDVCFVDKDILSRNKSVFVGNQHAPFCVCLKKDYGLIELNSLFNEYTSLPNCSGIFVQSSENVIALGSKLRQVFCPLKIDGIEVGLENVVLTISNKADFTDNLTMVDYTIYSNKQPDIVSGQLTINIKHKSEERIKVKLPPLKPSIGEEFFLKVRISTPKDGSKENELECAYPLDMANKQLPLFSSSKDIKDVKKYGDTIDVLLDRINIRYLNGNIEVLDTLGNLICCLPRPLFSKGEIECSSLSLYNNDMRSVSIEVMLCGKNSVVVSDVQIRDITTVYGTGDVVNQYQVLNVIGEKTDTIIQEISFDFPFNNVKWFGNEQNSGLNRIPNVYDITPPSSYSVTDTRWISAQCQNHKIYVSQIATPFSHTISSNKAMHIELAPTIDSVNTTYSIHLNVGSVNDILDSLYGYEYRVQQPQVLSPPVIKASSVKFTAPMTISIMSKDNAIIRYTTDGSTPTAQSLVYKQTFVIDSSTIVKAYCISDGYTPSFVSTRTYSYDYVKSTTFSRPPNTPYNRGLDTILFDGATSTADDLGEGWLGFSGGELTISVELSKQVKVDHVEIRFAHNPNRWAFAPDSLNITLLDENRLTTAKTGVSNHFKPSDAANISPIVCPFIISLDGQKTKYITFKIYPLPQIPSWHKAKGLKPWLMIDELKIVEQTNNPK